MDGSVPMFRLTNSGGDGLCCDERRVGLGPVALVEAAAANGRCVYRVRPAEEIAPMIAGTYMSTIGSHPSSIDATIEDFANHEFCKTKPISSATKAANVRNERSEASHFVHRQAAAEFTRIWECRCLKRPIGRAIPNGDGSTV